MFAPIPLVTTLVCCCALPAQGIAAFPSDHAAITNGDFNTNWFPYAHGVSRVMAIYESWDVTVPAGRPITRIGFRQDGTTASTGKQLQLQVLMGPTEKTAANAVTTFASNYFAPPTSVFGPGLYGLPDLGNILNPNPDGNMVWLTLATPYTPVAGKNLLVEFRVLANNAGGSAFNYFLDRADYVSPRATGPVGCAHSGNQVPTLLSRETRVGATWYPDLAQAPASQMAIWFISSARCCRSTRWARSSLASAPPVRVSSRSTACSRWRRSPTPTARTRSPCRSPTIEASTTSC